MQVHKKSFAMILPKKPVSHVGYFSSAEVDGVTWHTVKCSKEASNWIRTEFSQHQDRLWFEHMDSQWAVSHNVFDLHDKLYTLLLVRWSE